MGEDEIVTKEELSKVLKVGIRTIDRMRDEGMPCLRIGSNVRFQKEKVIQWIKERSKD